MTERERLVELLETPHKAELLREKGLNIECEKPEELIADFLLQNGVIVPSCNTDKVIISAMTSTGYKFWKAVEITDLLTDKQKERFIYVHNQKREQAIKERDKQ